MKRLAYADNEEATRELELEYHLSQCKRILDAIPARDRRAEPSSAAALHMLEHGHRLSFGCCGTAAARRSATQPPVKAAA